MARTPLTTGQVVALLAAAPTRLAQATDGLAPQALRSRPQPDEWSAVDVLAHLRVCSDVWGGAIATILGGATTFRAVNPRTWVSTTDSSELEHAPSLQAFTAQRSDLVVVLEALTVEGWSQAATVTGAGSPLERTVHQYAQRARRARAGPPDAGRAPAGRRPRVTGDRAARPGVGTATPDGQRTGRSEGRLVVQVRILGTRR